MSLVKEKESGTLKLDTLSGKPSSDDQPLKTTTSAPIIENAPIVESHNSSPNNVPTKVIIRLVFVIS